MKKLALLLASSFISLQLFSAIEVSTQAQLNSYINQGKVTVVKFYANWCGPCKTLNKTYIQLENKFGGEAINFIAVNIDNASALKKKYGAHRIPLVLFFKNGQIIHRVLGNSPADLTKLITRYSGR